MKIYFDTKYKRFLSALAAFSVSADELELCFDSVKHLAVKDKLNYDINALIFGKLCKLQTIKTGGQFLTQPYTIIHAPTDKTYKHFNRLRRWWDRRTTEQLHRRFMNLPAADALRFSLKARQDMERIVKLFEAIKYKPSPEEVKAGINKANGSLHRVALWYARYMGMTDPELAYLEPWTKIYAAMKAESEDNAFKRRYQQVLNSKQPK